MERYNPLAEGHIERAGLTKVGERKIYTVAEPEHPAAVTYLEGYKYILDKYMTADNRIVTGWVYRPPEPEERCPMLKREPEPEATEPEPELPLDKCEKCGREGDDLRIFDSDSEVYGVVCPCGHMWLAAQPKSEG